MAWKKGGVVGAWDWICKMGGVGRGLCALWKTGYACKGLFAQAMEERGVMVTLVILHMFIVQNS